MCFLLVDAAVAMHQNFCELAEQLREVTPCLDQYFTFVKQNRLVVSAGDLRNVSVIANDNVTRATRKRQPEQRRDEAQKTKITRAVKAYSIS